MWIGVAAGAIVPTGAKGKNFGVWIVQRLLYPGIDIVIQVIAIIVCLFRRYYFHLVQRKECRLGPQIIEVQGGRQLSGRSKPRGWLQHGGKYGMCILLVLVEHDQTV